MKRTGENCYSAKLQSFQSKQWKYILFTIYTRVVTMRWWYHHDYNGYKIRGHSIHFTVADNAYCA